MIRRLAPVVAALAALALSAAPASAGVLTDCDNPSSSKVFAPWLDGADYFLAPDGGFENGADGWTLSGGAAVVDGNESFDLSGPGSRSLGLSAGDSAQSPSVCVGLEHPTFRYVFRRTAGLPSATLRVSAVFPGGLSVPVGTVTGSSSWAPSPVTLIAANLLAPTVSFRFTAVSGSWQVDDVYVDPRGSH